jgi:hypothetical protein
MKEIEDGRARGGVRQGFGRGGGGALEALGGGGWADEHLRATGKLANGLGWAEGGRSKGSAASLAGWWRARPVAAAAMAQQWKAG